MKIRIIKQDVDIDQRTAQHLMKLGIAIRASRVEAYEAEQNPDVEELETAVVKDDVEVKEDFTIEEMEVMLEAETNNFKKGAWKRKILQQQKRLEKSEG